MCSSGESAIQEKYKEYHNKCVFWRRWIIAAGALFLVYFFFRLIREFSLSSWLLSEFPFLNNLNLQWLVNADAILKVSEAVGLSSLPIAGIYAVWGRNELGLKYSELLQSICPKYSIYVVIHFFAVLCCLWLSSVGALEASLLSLCIVLLGFPLQWRALCLLVLYPEDRRMIASYEWRKKLHLLGDESRKKTDFYDICSFTGYCLDADGIYDEKTPDIFTDGLLKYVEDHSEAPILYDIQVIWDRLLLHHSSAEQEILVRQIFQCLATKQVQKSSAIGIICAGYVLGLLHSRIPDNMSRDEPPVEVLIRVTNEIALLQRNIFGPQENSVVYYCSAVISFLDWMYALNRDVDIQDLPNNFKDLLCDLELTRTGSDAESVCRVLKGITEYMFDSCSSAVFKKACYRATGYRCNAE